ncbi:MAG TPA: hypothetical protein VJT33_13145 [bacterium]|nr:hypothetical protein [bacterium]
MTPTTKHAFAAASASVALVVAVKVAVAAPANFPIVLLPANTRVALRFLTPLDSATATQGDVVEFAVAANVVFGHFVLVQKNAHVNGAVVRVTPPGLFGRSAAIVIGYLDAPTTDGGVVQLRNIIISRTRVTTSVEGAAAASLAGAVLLGPVGLVAGAFVRGGSVEAPTGAITFGNTGAAAPVMIPVAAVPVDSGTHLGLRFAAPIDSATAAPGDLVALTVVGDVIVGHFVVIPAGAPAVGLVLRVTRPGPYGTSAAVLVGALVVRDADGQALPLENVVISRGHISTLQIAAATAEAAGTYLLGQVGTLVGALVHGGEVRAPRGTIVVDATVEPAIVRIPDVSP